MSPLLGSLTGPVLLIVGFVLALLAGVWVVRRLLIDRQSKKLTKRAELWSGLLILFGVCLPQIALRVVNLNDREWATTGWDWGWLTALAAFSLFKVWRLPALWRSARTESQAAQLKRRAHVPTLKSQLLLIVLPVAGLAVVGVVSLLRDRAAVEATAKTEAEELAREFVMRLSTAWPGNLSEVELGANTWLAALGTVGRGTGPTGSSETDVISARFLERARRHIHGSPEDAFPVIARFAEDGSLMDPPAYPKVPRIAGWAARLSDAAGNAWRDVLEAEVEAGNGEALIDAARRMRETASGPGPTLQAEFLALRRSSDTNGQIVELLQFGRRAVRDRAESAAGVPLGALALAEAHRRAPSASLDQLWLEVIADLVGVQPSSFSPWALSVGGILATHSGDPSWAARLDGLRQRWLGAERVRGLAADLAAKLVIYPTLQTNLWLTNGSGTWLALVQPWHSTTFATIDGYTRTLTNRETQVRLFRNDTLELAAFNALHTVATINGRERATPPRLPTGMTLSLELEGHAFNVPADRPLEVVSAPVLAEAAGEFRLEGEWAVDGQGKPQRFDVWPSRPRFTVRVHLADSAALFAAQRRQQWLFGGMILVTAGVAGLGAWQMNRAFRRQLALNAEKSNFVASVSHELRTPLASLRLLAEGLAAGRVEEESKRREYAGFLVQETRRLGALVENVLDFARIEQGRKQYQFEPTDLSRLVTATVRLFEPLAAERHVRLELNLPAGLAEPSGNLELNADGAALQQALVNLLDNALKHAPADSVVTVALEGAAPAPLGWVRLSVTDSGPGIPPEDHERIFERFFRRGSELRRETQGVGLGLAIVKHIVAGHHGRVWVESQPGQGARFVVELPVGGTE
jgi:two-component system phosphate regulon sensor histidine kinase PhoR